MYGSERQQERRLSSTSPLCRVETGGRVGLESEIQVIPNVREVMNLETERTMRMSALKIDSYVKEDLDLPMVWELETILSLKKMIASPEI